MYKHHPLREQYGLSYSLSAGTTSSFVRLERTGGTCKLFPPSLQTLSEIPILTSSILPLILLIQPPLVYKKFGLH